MKVVFFTYDEPNHISGVDSWLKRLVPELRKKGIIPIIILLIKGKLEDLKKVVYYKSLDIEVYTIDLKMFPYAESRTKEILKILNQVKPQVMLPGYMMPAYYAVKWAKRAGIKSVTILHSDDLFYHALTDVLVENKDWQTDFFVGVSTFLTEYLVEKLKNKKLVQCIPYGVPILSQTAVRTNDTLRILYIGRLEDEQKRITDVVHAFGQCVNKYPNVTAHVYGDGSQKQKVISLINDYDNQRVAYMGSLESEEVMSVALNYHVVVLLSDYEGLPLALLESMSCGLVPICLNIKSGINDLLINNQNGVIVNDRGEDFLNAVGKLIDVEYWKTLSNNAKDTIIGKNGGQTYALHKIADQWVTEFEKLMKNSNQWNKIESIKIPTFIKLPKYNHQLRWENRYQPSTVKLFTEKLISLTSKTKKKLVNSFNNARLK